MLPSMPVLFPRESQSGDGFLHLLAPAPAMVRPAPPVLQIADEAANLPQNNIKIGTTVKGNKKETEEVPPETEEELNEIQFVSSYYNKVLTKLGVEKFARFQDTLNQFEATKESPTELYRRVEALFGEDEELTEEFLMFLTPGQASEVGRFMDHLMLSRISKFIQYLQSTYCRKPAKLRQVARALQCARGGAAGLRARVEPHLRGGARLLARFRALLPDERLPDSLYAEGRTEEFPEGAWAADRGRHRIELDEPAGAEPAQLDVTYLQGRVFLQDGRSLRPARVTFPGSALAPHEHTRRLLPTEDLAAADSDDDRSSPRRTGAKNLKSPKRAAKAPCVRNIMKVPKEKNKSPERTPKNTEPVKKTVKVVIDAQIEAKSAASNAEKTLLELSRVVPEVTGSTLVNQGVRIAADNALRNKRKREESPEEVKGAVTVEERKKSSKIKQLKRLEAKKTEELNQKVENGRNHVTKQAKIVTAKEDKTKSVKFKLETQKSEDVKIEQTEINKSHNIGTPEVYFLKPEIPKLHIKKQEHCDWTRNEDKTILQVLKRETESEETFTKIMELLPHRTIAEVKARFFHVMDLLQQMALGEVT